MTNDIEKYSDIVVEDVPSPSGKVFSSEAEAKKKKETQDLISNRQREYESLIKRFEKVRNESKPHYELQHADTKRFEQMGKELNALNNEILALTKELQNKKEKYVTKKFRGYLISMLSLTSLLPFLTVVLLKITGNPTLVNTSDFIQYLVGFPIVSSVMSTLLTYPFFERMKRNYEKEYTSGEEFNEINSKILDKQLIMDSKDKEYAKLREQINERNKIINDCDYRMRCIKWQIENIREQTMNEIFKTPNNGSLGISIENFDTRQILSLKI